MTTISDSTPEILSEIVVFLERQYSLLLTPTILLSSKAPPLPVNAPQPQGQQKAPRIYAERPVTIFIVYAPDDERFRILMERELNTLLKQGLNIVWDFFDVTTALDFITDIDNPLNERDLILLLVSPDFVTLDFCYDPLMKQAVERHKKGAWVSPVLLRKSRWERTPFGSKPLPVLPKNRIPVIDWPNEDDAFFDISVGIERGIKYLAGHQ